MSHPEKFTVRDNGIELKNRYKGLSLLGVMMVAWDRLAAVCSVLFWTTIVRTRLHMLGCFCGPGLRVDGPVVIRAPRRDAIRIGCGVRINSRFRSNLVGLMTPTVLQCLGNGRITIGDHCGLSAAVLSARSCISVGKYVQIGGNVRIFDHDFHSLDYRVRRDPVRGWRECATEPVFIGDDVFIGTNAIILKGVQIGERSVIGAGAVVALKEIPPDSLVVGNPARVLRRLSGSVANAG
ncbi:MAG: acyltransferase [Verrucomicrobiae bacterium]|nr:acyltransferase [Verrucomicrobiae bacterium]